MGILKNAVELQRATGKMQMKAELKRNFVIDRLRELGITHLKNGVSIHTLDYDRLKEELVLAELLKIDNETDAAKWF